jgi:RecA-family ATPase
MTILHDRGERAPAKPRSSRRKAMDQPAYPAFLGANEFVEGAFPPPAYLINGFVVADEVNLLYGNGGTGKSTLALHMAVAVASGTPFFGRPTKKMGVVMVIAEDSAGAVTQRLQATCNALNVDQASLPLDICCLPGWDLSIAKIDDDGEVTPGPFLAKLEEALALGPAFLIIDTVTDIAQLDENIRAPVNTLCKKVLGRLCRKYGATILATAHPSKSAMADNSQYAGSTAWNNAVRNRLSLTLGKSPNVRVLRVEKSNYGPLAHIELVSSGLTMRAKDQVQDAGKDIRQLVYEVVLAMIDKGINIVRESGSGQKPRDVAAEIRAEHGIDLTPHEVRDHLSSLERDGKLRYEPGGNARRGQRAGFRRP